MQTDYHKETANCTFNDGVVTKAATCKDTGVKTYTCTECGGTYTETIDKIAHTPVDDAAVEAKCETTGKTAGSHCDVCGEIIVAQETISATGHTAVKDAAEAATCTTAGKTAGSHCSVCGDTIVAQETIPATGHTWGDWETVTAPTCSALGEEKRTCSVCTTNETRAIAVDPDAHSFVIVEEYCIPATCNSYGFKYEKCSLCNHLNDYVELTPDEDGWYTVPAGTGFAVISVSTSKVVEETNTDPDGTGTDGCGHICHSRNSFMKLIWTILRFFCKIFNINQTCGCGVKHW